LGGKSKRKEINVKGFPIRPGAIQKRKRSSFSPSERADYTGRKGTPKLLNADKLGQYWGGCKREKGKNFG